MFGKKKEVKKRTRPPGSLAQYGIFEVPDLAGLNAQGLGIDVDDDGNDEDLEAELAALTSGNGARQPRRKAPPIPTANLDAMVADSMKDIGSDEELSGDDDDPFLLDELKEITGDESVSPEPPHEEHPAPASINEDMREVIKILEERLEMYQKAVKKAKSGNESGKARRYARGIKSIEEMLADARSGKAVVKDDIPPVLPASAISDAPANTTTATTDSPINTDATSDTTHVQEPVSPPPAASEKVSPPAAPAVSEETMAMLKERQHQFRIAAVAWKKSGNTEEAINLVKIAKQFDVVMEALLAGNEVDLSDMPPPPALPGPASASPSPAAGEKEDSEVQRSVPTEQPVSVQEKVGVGDVGAALKERLEIYRRSKTTAEEEGNTSKARRYGRICKQFEDAIKLHTRGKPVPLDELPTPPGFPPLATPAPATPPKPQVESKAEPEPTSEPIPEPEPSEEEPARSSPKRAPPVPPPRVNSERKKQRQTTRAGKQLADLQQRQHELKQAALSAKKDGDLELARDYLRQAKGMQPLIEASEGGLPVDMDTVPLSPLAKMQISLREFEGKDDESFTVLSTEECIIADGSDEQIYENLDAQLIKQIKKCLATRDHSKALGDVASYNKWERLALGYTRDLDMLRVRRRDALPPPQHHYETKTHATVQCCTDLGDGDLEVSIIRGVNYPKEADTYVTFEYPYPTENPLSDKTSTVRESSNPEYEAVFPLSGAVDRKSRQCQRVYKRHALKCQVWAKGGFFRSDSLIGTVAVKLQPLETRCELHDSFPLMEGRKAVGGKLEVKMRVRNPILTKQIEQVTEKWLTIDQ